MVCTHCMIMSYFNLHVKQGLPFSLLECCIGSLIESEAPLSSITGSYPFLQARNLQINFLFLVSQTKMIEMTEKNSTDEHDRDYVEELSGRWHVDNGQT